MHVYLVELDSGVDNILWARGRDLSLIRQLKEGFIVDI